MEPKLYKEDGTEVTKRVEQKLTQFIKGTDVHTDLASYELARKKRSYHYPIYNSNRILIGFGIPK
ncbi:conserved protein of unknown function [Tenacibaculum sp. 190524A02b]|uniref:hypothetical protein n=1 Tax=Tenacibaculum vairaonense TaxID=3137860 RepID=UPI0032B264FF